jgi:hypothetical protein
MNKLKKAQQTKGATMSDNELQEIEAEIVPVTPMGLIAKAQASNASIEQMAQLLDLQIRYEDNEAKKAYNVAMAKFRSECPTIKKTRKGHNTMYAGLAETIEQVKPFLAKNGLSYHWKTTQPDGKITVECVVTHELGHSESTTLGAGADKTGSKNDIQAIGSSVAYLERYTLSAILGLSSREIDDNGESSEGSMEFITESNAMDIEALISEVKADKAKFLEYMTIKAKFMIEDVAGIPADMFGFAVKVLEGKRGR